MGYLIITKPEASEHDPYYSRYINLVNREDIIRVLSMQIDDTLALLRDIPDSRGDFRYAPDKWSVKEVIGHVIDTERVFAYRALTFARNDRTSLPGFEQDDWIRGGSYAAQPLKELASEFECVRRSNIYLFQHLDGDAWMRRGKANNAEVSVRALAYIIAGHEMHHRQILQTKYIQP
jgi:hypothetical protein